MWGGEQIVPCTRAFIWGMPHLVAQPYTKFSVGNYVGVSWPSILPRVVKRGGGGRIGGK